MADPFYIERSVLSRRVLTLNGYQLEAAGKFANRTTKNVVDLRQASPDVEVRWVKLYGGVVYAFVGLVGMIALYRTIMSQRVLPHEFALFPLEMLAIFIWVGCRFSTPIKVARVCNKRGDVLMEIIEDRKNPADFGLFLELLRERIREFSLG